MVWWYLFVMFQKQKRLCIDFKKTRRDPKLVWIKGEVVDSMHKYLGVIFDNKLCWNKNISCIVKKADTRLYCLRKLKYFGISTFLLAIFYSAVVCSALTFGMVCWRGNISKHKMGSLDKIGRKWSEHWRGLF